DEKSDELVSEEPVRGRRGGEIKSRTRLRRRSRRTALGRGFNSPRLRFFSPNFPALLAGISFLVPTWCPSALPPTPRLRTRIPSDARCSWFGVVRASEWKVCGDGDELVPGCARETYVPAPSAARPRRRRRSKSSSE